jgi:methyl-accepting chemotaxis protein
MKNLKISTKINIIVIVSILAILFVAFFGITRMNQMSEKIDTMSEKINTMSNENIALLTRLTRMVESFGIIRMYVRDSVIAISDTHRQDYVNAIFPRYEQLLADTEAYVRVLEENNLTDTEEYEVARQILADLPHAAEIVVSIVELSLAGELDAAAHRIETVCVPFNDALAFELSRLAYINEERARVSISEGVQLADEGTQLASSALWIAIIVAIITAAVLLILGILVRQSIAKPIEKMMLVMRNLAVGDFSLQFDEIRRDEIGQLAMDVHSLTSVMKSLIEDFANLAHEVNENGNISYRMDPLNYLGVFETFCEQGNALVEKANEDMQLVFEVLEAMGDGNFDINVRKLPGEKAAINLHFDTIVERLREIHHEIARLFKNATEGVLDSYADVDKYKGDWAKLISEMNNLLSTVADPLAEIEICLEEMSKGNFETPVKGDYKGAFDALKQTVNSTGQELINNVDEITGILHALAKGDLTVPIDRAYIGSYRPIKEALISILKSLNYSLWEVQAIAAKVQEGTEQMAGNVTNMANGTSRQAVAIKTLSNSLESINEKTRLSAETASDANKRSQQSTDSAQSGNDDMKTMITTIEGIKSSSANITKIIEVIQNIAFQTNLLALNASVEAARAGEHGKGFSVVAEEVRALATRSQAATKETIVEIEESLRRVNESMNVANGAADSLNMIVNHVQEVSSLISSISTMSQEQAEAIEQVYNGVSEISQVVEANSASSMECSTASQELSQQAEMLKRAVSVFQVRPPREAYNE